MSTPTIGSVQKTKMSIEAAMCYSLPVPAAPGTEEIKAATNIANGALGALTQPKFPRNVVVTIVDTTPSITAGIVTIVGTDQDGNPVTEVYDCAAGVGTYTGNIAFAKIASITLANFATLGGAGDETIAIGSGTKIGLPCGLNGRLVRVVKSVHNMADEAIGTVNATYRTLIPTNAPNADHHILIYYLVAYDLFMG